MRDARGRTALHVAAERQPSAVIRVLIEAGADVNDRTRNGETPLHYAAAFNDADSIAALLDAGADPQAATQFLETPLALIRHRRHLKDRSAYRRLLASARRTDL